MEHKVVFMERDRVINVPWHSEEDDSGNYVLSWEDFEFIDYSDSAIRYLLQKGYMVVVVSNQECIGKGYCTEGEMLEITTRMWTAIKPPAGSKYGTVICPHTVKEVCSCKKPKPGLIYAAAFVNGMCLKEAWMVGACRDDMLAAWAAGIRKLVQINPEVAVLEPSPKGRNTMQPTIAPSLAVAATYIVATDMSCYEMANGSKIFVDKNIPEDERLRSIS